MRKDVSKIRPHNPVYVVITCLFVPWQLINTYYSIDDADLIISRYYAQSESVSAKRMVNYVDLSKLEAFGFPVDLGTESMEPIKSGTYGSYIPQEIQFMLNDHTRIPWNVKPYTKKQIRILSEYIFANYSAEPGKYLQKAIGFMPIK